ncbi:hypothetical protein [Companilactobacillus mishanensis]|uniref:hypothetical protein n=1 Tax=Companilactobacillus mishanensis TaxID=2486008 RepID=UPI001297EE03|nr:hypothetical protein [Companilactobacillus mishanensis]MQS89731.1 hypothetical protein [Companilactobacillus mishanensis]
MMHSRPIAMLLFAFFWTLAIWAIWQLLRREKSIIPLIIAISMAFTLPIGFKQNILLWNNAFIVYVPPIAIILTYLVICKKLGTDHNSKVLAVVAFILGLSGGLFLETTTILQIAIGIIIILNSHKHPRAYQISYLAGSVLSALIMFTNLSYFTSNASNYRRTSFALTDIWKMFSSFTHYWLLSFNLLVIFSICLAIILLSIRRKLNSYAKWIEIIMSLLFMIYFAFSKIYLSYFKPKKQFLFSGGLDTFNQLDTIASLSFILFLGFSIFVQFKKNKLMYLYYLLAGISFAPVLVVMTPISCRPEFIPYVFLYLIAGNFVLSTFEIYNLKFFIPIIILLIIGIAGNYQVKMYQNYFANLERVKQPDFLDGAGPLKTHVPHRDYVFYNDDLLQQDGTYWRNYLDRHDNEN